MKDYSLIKSEEFILNYEITLTKEIVINLASGESLVIPYTKSNEKEILKIMRNQVTSIKKEDLKNKLKSYIKDRKSNIRFMRFCNLCMLVLSIRAISIGSPFLIGECALLLVGFSSIVCYDKRKLKEEKRECKALYNDYLKNIDFINNEVSLNRNLEYNPKVFDNVRDKTKRNIENIIGSRRLNINDMDKIKRIELNQMLSNSVKDEELLSNSLVKGKTLTKKRHYKGNF